MQRKFEAILPHLMTCFTRLIDGMSSSIIPKYFFIQRLHAHLDSCNAHFTSKLTIFICHIFRSCFYGKSDNSMCGIFIFFQCFGNGFWIRDFLAFVHDSVRISFGRRNLDVFEIFIEGIAGIVKLFDEFYLVCFGIDVKCSAKDDHLYLIGFVTRQGKGK